MRVEAASRLRAGIRADDDHACRTSRIAVTVATAVSAEEAGWASTAPTIVRPKRAV
jgi:hypothetical protein